MLKTILILCLCLAPKHDPVTIQQLIFEFAEQPEFESALAFYGLYEVGKWREAEEYLDFRDNSIEGHDYRLVVKHLIAIRKAA